MITRLETLFDGYSTVSPSPTFLFLGNFISPSFVLDASGIARLARLFDTLADLLLRHPNLIASSKFIFLPGPRDIGSNGLLPRPQVGFIMLYFIFIFFHLLSSELID